MGHFAKIENNKVVNVIIADQEFIDKGLVEGVYLETTPGVVGGIVYQDPPTQPIQEDELPAEPTPTDLPSVRKNYGGIGMDYDPELDAFIPVQPYSSWTLNENTCLWEAPIPYPDDGGHYLWDDENSIWVSAEWNPDTYTWET